MKNKFIYLLVILCFLLSSPGKNTYAHSSASYLSYVKDRTVLIVRECLDDTKEGWGSGFIYKGNQVITAAHVIDDAEGCSFKVSREGEKVYSGRVIKQNDKADLALMVVNHNYNVTVEFAESVLGEDIVAVGYPVQPFDGDNQYLSILYGNISTKNIPAGDKIVDRISALIFFGNSGGPVFNSLGQVVGMSDLMHRNLAGYAYTVRTVDILAFLEVP